MKIMAIDYGDAHTGIAISDQLNKLALYRWAQENSHLYSALREWAEQHVSVVEQNRERYDRSAASLGG